MTLNQRSSLHPSGYESTPDAPARRGRGALLAFLVLWAVWSAAVGWIRTSSPGLDHGDITTDSNILNAGENFDRDGFWASWGVPTLDTVRAEGRQPDHYVTYPPGCYWLHQSLKLLGAKELWHFRLISVFWSSLAVLLFFVLCTRVSGAVLPAALAATAYMLSRPFTEYADNLHYLSFSQVTLFGTLLGWVGVEQAQTARARTRWLLLAAGVFAIDSLVTFEHTLFIAAFAMVRIVIARRWGLLLPLALLGLVPVGMLCARLAINAAAIGGVNDVWMIMQAKLRQRTGAAGGAGWLQLGQELLDRLGWRPARSGPDSENAKARVGVLAPAFLAPMFVLMVISLATWHLEGMKSARKAAGLAFALLAGGATWPIVMREHAVVHTFTVLLLLPGIAAAIGALITFGWWQWRLQPRGAPVRLAGFVAGSVLLIAHVSQMRHSHLLNVRANLDAQVFQRNQSIQIFESRFAAARPAFADLDRLYMFSHDAQLGRKLAVPFDNDTEILHAPLGAGEAQMLDWRVARRAMIEGEAGLGPPRFLAEPAGHLAFFFPSREGLGSADMKLSDGSRISRLWVETTLDGVGVVVGAAVHARPGDGAAGLTLKVRGRDAAGKVSWRRSVRAGKCAAVTDDAVLWVSVIENTDATLRSIDVWFTREDGRRLTFDPEFSGAPEGSRMSSDRRTVELKVSAARKPEDLAPAE